MLLPKIVVNPYHLFLFLHFAVNVLGNALQDEVEIQHSLDYNY